MLTELYIQNIAVIEKTVIPLMPGLNIFTGETGAGKSILIDAISAVLGFRTSRELIRTGADRAVVTAVFDELSAETLEALTSCGYEPEEDGTLLLSRELSAEGKSSCKIGGRPAAVSVLREVAQTLIDIHGQHDNQALMDSGRHIRFIDRFCGVGGLLAEYQKQYETLVLVKRELEKLTMDETEKAYRVDLLTYQIDEMETAALRPGEDDELSAQKKRCNNAAKIIECITQADCAMNGDDESTGLLELLDTAKDAVSTAGRYFEELAPVAQRMEEMYYELREYASDLRGHVTELELDNSDLDRVEARLDLIYRLKQKYGGTVEAVLATLSTAREELSAIGHADERRKLLQSQLAQGTYSAQKLAESISQRRCEAAARFASQVGEELKFLDMPFVKLKVEHDIGPLSPSGIDNMEFFISTNPGEPPKPLSKIASGGELSRIMLSLKNVLADNDPVGTLIFDEIDAGVSGRAAQKIGRKLKQASRGRQIICVTHLAQVASYADHHLLIEKSVRGGRTYTEVRALGHGERVGEIARIIGGDTITDTVLSSAREMLELARGMGDEPSALPL